MVIEKFKTKMDALNLEISLFEQALSVEFPDISAEVWIADAEHAQKASLLWGYKAEWKTGPGRQLFLLGTNAGIIRLLDAPAFYRVAAAATFNELLDELGQTKPERLRKIEEGISNTKSATNRCLKWRHRAEIQTA